MTVEELQHKMGIVEIKTPIFVKYIYKIVCSTTNGTTPNIIIYCDTKEEMLDKLNIEAQYVGCFYNRVAVYKVKESEKE